MSSLVLLCLLGLAVANPVLITKQEIPPVSKDASFSYAVDVSTSVSQSTFQCIRGQGYSVAFIRAYKPDGSGSYDPNGGLNVQNAYKAGLGIEVFMTPQPASAKTAAQQVDELYQGLTGAGVTVRQVWIQVTSPINWPNSQVSNQNFIAQAVNRLKQYSITAGIYTNVYDWNQITGAWNNLGTGIPLWYWNVVGNGPSGETVPNFTDFRAFGCWTQPAVKQFAQAESICGIAVNRDVYQASGVNIALTPLMEKGKIIVGGNVRN